MSESADPTLSTALSSADPGPSSILSIQSTTESASEHSNISTRPSVSPVPTIESMNIPIIIYFENSALCVKLNVFLRRN